MERHSEAALRAMARDVIRRGKLPLTTTRSVLAGPGSGRTCSLCNHPIERREVEYEVPGQNGAASIHFHLACESIWAAECLRHLESEAQAELQRSCG